MRRCGCARAQTLHYTAPRPGRPAWRTACARWNCRAQTAAWGVGPCARPAACGGIDGGGYTFDRRQLLRTTIDVPAACACIAFLTLHGRRIDSRLSCVHAFVQSWLLLFDVPRASASYFVPRPCLVVKKIEFCHANIFVCI
jgi:hypothetical protein